MPIATRMTHHLHDPIPATEPHSNKNQQNLVALLLPKQVKFILILMTSTSLARDTLITDLRNQEKSANVSPAIAQHQQLHIQVGQLVKSLVFCGVDGSTNALVVILSSYSAGYSPKEILLYAISIVVADAVSMGLGDYLSTKAEIDFVKTEEARELYEVEHLLEDQKKEIIDMYVKKSFSVEDATRVADLYSTNKQVFVDIMMLQELKLVVTDPSLSWKRGLTAFCSFIIFGIQPVLPYIVTSGIMKNEDQPWVICVCIGAVELFGLGILKATIIGLNKWRAAIEILIVGTAAVAAGYGIGFAFSQ